MFINENNLTILNRNIDNYFYLYILIIMDKIVLKYINTSYYSLCMVFRKSKNRIS